MADQLKLYQNIKIKKIANSRISIEGEVTAPVFTASYEEAVQHLKKDFEVPGFRKGHVPDSVFIERVNKGQLLEEAAERALRKTYPEVVADHALRPLTIPQITITKLAPNNPLGFKAEVAVRPEIKLPDYKKITKRVFSEELPLELREEEVDGFIKQLLDMEKQIRSRLLEGKEGAVSESVELTDEFVKQLGPFENIEDFKTKVRDDMLAQKKVEAAREKRESFAKELIEASSLVLPDQVVDEEFQTSFDRIFQDLKDANLTLEAYAQKLNKTEEEFRREKRQQIESQIKLRFILEDIAETEKISLKEEEVQAEIARLKKTHPEAPQDQLLAYVELLLRNEAALKFLESLRSI